MTYKFSAREAIKFGWHQTWKHVGDFLKMLGIMFLISLMLMIVLEIPGYFLKDTFPFAYTALNGISFILKMTLNVFYQIALIRVALQIVDGQPVSLSNAWKVDWGMLGRYLWACSLVMLIVLGGFLLLIVPGFVLLYKYFLTHILVLDKNLKPMDALRASGLATQGHKMKMFQLGLLSLGVLILGFLCLFVGVFFAAPMCIVAMMYAYRKLVPAQNASTEVVF
jgi:uncharacterized membrane protein